MKTKFATITFPSLFPYFSSIRDRNLLPHLTTPYRYQEGKPRPYNITTISLTLRQPHAKPISRLHDLQNRSVGNIWKQGEDKSKHTKKLSETKKRNERLTIPKHVLATESQRLIPTSKGLRQRRWKLLHCPIDKAGFNCSAFAKCTLLLQFGGKDGRILLWDLAKGKRLYSLESASIIHALCFNPNRYPFCAATKSSIEIWDWESNSIVVDLKVNLKQEFEMVAEGTTTQTNDGKTKVIYCTSLSWSANGSTLLTVGLHIRSIFETQREVYNTTERISVSSFIASLLIGGYACIDHTDGARMNLIGYQVAKAGLEEKLGKLATPHVVLA
ncbi:hypothetical protein L6452_00602 [Arctium lappa]|uniref:Uncharacterized protein n=1 Tax=Arctium lappa TaxID=4217 RepID=A0ACB9FFM3_ARCLA|nr:hypothetical protein L6452_00602 [Arctium lappa]